MDHYAGRMLKRVRCRRERQDRPGGQCGERTGGADRLVRFARTWAGQDVPFTPEALEKRAKIAAAYRWVRQRLVLLIVCIMLILQFMTWRAIDRLYIPRPPDCGFRLPSRESWGWTKILPDAFLGRPWEVGWRPDHKTSDMLGPISRGNQMHSGIVVATFPGDHHSARQQWKGFLATAAVPQEDPTVDQLAEHMADRFSEISWGLCASCLVGRSPGDFSFWAPTKPGQPGWQRPAMTVNSTPF
jgi:hypothetical protein